MTEKFHGLDFEKPLFDLEEKISSLRLASSGGKLDLSSEMAELEKKFSQMKSEIYGSLTPWQRVQIARHPKRPYMLDYVNSIFTDFTELHGDRAFSDDRAIVAGFALLEGRPVALVGQQKGRDLQENLDRNFAMAHPEGYRKAIRVMKLAEKFGKPVITLIDTPGAYPGIGAEERGQAEAIARNLREMSGLRVPVVSIVLGEGGSGGALGIGVCNRLLMLENSYYSVISPEGCAAILFRDAAKSRDAAVAMKINAEDLKKLGVVDEIITEPAGGAHQDPAATAQSVKEAFIRHLSVLGKMTGDELADDRYNKFRSIAVFEEDDDKPQMQIKKVKKISKKKSKKIGGK